MERIVVLGLGNILYGDEGFGVRVAERLYSRYAFPDNVEIVDAGTQGHPLLAFVERATRLLLLDAVDFGLQPGTTVEKDSTRHPGLFERAQDEPTPEQLFRSAGPCGAEGLPPGGNPADRSPASGHDLWKHAEPPVAVAAGHVGGHGRSISFMHGACPAVRRVPNPYSRTLRSRLSGMFPCLPERPAR